MATQKNIIVRLQDSLDSVQGQSFLNYAYSWGAAIVILGTLFKLTHINGADLMLFVGMGTEVFVFIISGFDRQTVVDRERGDERSEYADEASYSNTDDYDDRREVADEVQPVVEMTPAQTSFTGSDGYKQATVAAAAAAIDTQQLIEIVQSANKELMERAQATCSPEIDEATQNYLSQLKQLTEVLANISERVSKMNIESDEMEKMNRTVTGINTLYEMQLKNVSLQIGTIDQINDQMRKMAQLIEEMNGVYGRMIQALTVNMKNTQSGAM